MSRLTKNFTVKEMECPCCGGCDMNDMFMNHLQSLRTECNFAFIINSGWRCMDHNQSVSSNTRGQHSEGLAVDIKCTDRYKRAEMITNALQMDYFLDIAISKTFIHIAKGNQIQGIGVY